MPVCVHVWRLTASTAPSQILEARLIRWHWHGFCSREGGFQALLTLLEASSGRRVCLASARLSHSPPDTVLELVPRLFYLWPALVCQPSSCLTLTNAPSKWPWGAGLHGCPASTPCPVLLGSQSPEVPHTGFGSSWHVIDGKAILVHRGQATGTPRVRELSSLTSPLLRWKIVPGVAHEL